MNLADVRELARFRAKYRGLSWDQIGALFGVTGTKAREEWLVWTEREEWPAWWRAARDLYGEGMGSRRIAKALGYQRTAVRHALSRMGIADVARLRAPTLVRTAVASEAA